MSELLQIRDITSWLESLAPLSYQESYDNAGLLTGRHDTPVKKILVTLDCTEAVVEEAVATGCNLIVAHHPVIFSGLKKLNGKNYVERTVISAIRNDIAIYAIHTNLDNVHNGVNHKIAEKLGLKDLRILAPKTGLLKKLVTFVPSAHLEKVRAALFTAGAGHIGHYDECSFSSEGTGTYRGDRESNPFAGKKGEHHHEKELRLEVLFPASLMSAVITGLLGAHPYEEVAYDIISLENQHPEAGAGMIGELETAMEPKAFLDHVRTSMAAEMVRFTPFSGRIKKVALCGGAGSFLLKNALSAGADAYLTADFKYHEFFDAEGRLMIADIGHYESEFFTKELLKDLILKKFPTFAVLLSEINTNPIKYYYGSS